MTNKEMLALVAIALTLIGYYPYIRGLMLGKIIPHVFSWVIWSFVTVSVFSAQIYDGAGAGAWHMVVTGTITIFVAITSYFKTTEFHADKINWFILLFALSALPVWFITSNPLWAVIILTIVDSLGYVPTIRKSFIKPYEESSFFFFVFSVRNTVSIFAIENYTVTTVLFPSVSGFFCFLVMSIITYRRIVLRYKESLP